MKTRQKISLRERILEYYRKRPGIFVSGGEIERLVSQKTKYKSSNASRRLRELCEDNMLERKEEGGHVWYRYIPQKRTVSQFIVVDGVAKEFKKTIEV